MVLLHLRCHYTEHQGGQNISHDIAVTNWLMSLKSVTKAIIGKEIEANRPHLHCYVDYSLTMSTFRQHLKKEFPNMEGNKDYSLKKVDNPSSLMSYICKEGDVKYKGFSDEEKSQILPWVTKEEYKKNEQKKVNGNCNQFIVEELQKKYPGRKWHYVPEDMSIIVSHIQRVYGAGFKQISSIKVRDNALGILNSLNVGSLHSKLFSEAFPDLFCHSYVDE